MPDPTHSAQPTPTPTAGHNFSHYESGFFDASKSAKSTSEHSEHHSKTFTASISSANQPLVKNNFIPATIILAIISVASLICAGIFLAQSLSKSSTITVLESQKADLEQRILELQHSSSSDN